MRNAKLAWVAILILFLLISVFYFLSVPNISILKKQNPKKTAFMEYREQESQEKGRKIRIDQRWVPLSNICPYLIKAVLIAEDDKFWRHEGFDYEAIHKALEKDLKAKQSLNYLVNMDPVKLNSFIKCV